MCPHWTVFLVCLGFFAFVITEITKCIARCSAPPRFSAYDMKWNKIKHIKEVELIRDYHNDLEE